MKHLRHQSRKKEVYESDLVMHRAPLGDFWRERGQKRRGKVGPATNLQGPAGARRVQGGCEYGSKGNLKSSRVPRELLPLKKKRDISFNIF